MNSWRNFNRIALNDRHAYECPHLKWDKNIILIDIIHNKNKIRHFVNLPVDPIRFCLCAIVDVNMFFY